MIELDDGIPPIEKALLSIGPAIVLAAKSFVTCLRGI